MAVTQLDFEIENLACASCAAKMEDQMKKLPEIKQAALDFGSGRLHLTVREATDRSRLTATLNQIIRSVEEQARLVDAATQVKRPSWQHSFPKHKLLRLLAGLLPFLAALLLPLPGPAVLLLYVAAWLILGSDVLWKALRRLFSRRLFDENFLMASATIGALLIGEYPEAVAVMLFYQLGEMFQDMAVNHSRSSIRALTGLRPEFANRLTGDAKGGYERIAPEQVLPGDSLLIMPGERVPLDVEVIEGESDVDTSMLTGESLPAAVLPGREILAGSVNGGGLLKVRVLRPYRDSSIARMLEMAENAAARKSQAEQFITKFASWYTPAMVVLAVLLAIVPPLILSETFSVWIYRALILLVISCPCALVLSVPLSYFAGLGAASARGILVKGGQYLERLATVNQFVFDKTGTLTEGRFKIEGIRSASGTSKDEVLRLAAELEGGSSHPIARSIHLAAASAGLVDPDPSAAALSWDLYENHPGTGILAHRDGHIYWLGNNRIFQSGHSDLPPEMMPETGCQAVWLTRDGSTIGMIGLSDRIRADVPEMLIRLKQQGARKIVMLTGDRPEIAQKIAKQLEIDEVVAGLLPQHKVEQLEMRMLPSFTDRLTNHKSGKKAPGRYVTAFVGDGINDAPVLARADLGIAVGSASDAAFESADMVLMGHEPSKLNEAIDLARKTARIVRQNVALTLGLKGIIVLLALAGWGGIWQAVFADVGVSLLAVLNALRLLKKQSKVRPENSNG